MDLLAAHALAIAAFDDQVRAVAPDQWQLPTPCTEWSVRDLVNHLVYEQLWAVPLLAGATLAEVGDRFDGDVLGADPVAAWTDASTAARAAWTAPGATERAVEISSGVVPAPEYGWQMVGDAAVHAWDLATAIGHPVTLDDRLVRTLLAWGRVNVPQWQGIGIFDPPVPLPDNASPQNHLVALFGRRPQLD